MHTSDPDLTDLSDEPESTYELYGDDARRPGSFAANCLLARRMAQRGVRFIQLFHRGWDQHIAIKKQLPEAVPRRRPGFCRIGERPETTWNARRYAGDLGAVNLEEPFTVKGRLEVLQRVEIIMVAVFQSGWRAAASSKVLSSARPMRSPTIFWKTLFTFATSTQRSCTSWGLTMNDLYSNFADFHNV